MTREEFYEIINADDDEYLAFDRVTNPLHECRDIAALLLLHKLAPVRRGNRIMSYARDGEILLETNRDELLAVASAEDILTLKRCGVRYDEEDDFCLKMYV